MMPGDPGAGASMPGGPGMPGAGASGGPGGPGMGLDQKPDFRYPVTAVNSFLVALRAKDPERLADATALRSKYEASEKNKKLFESILSKTLPDNELNDLASKLEGYQVINQNLPKSTGKLGVILAKRSGNDQLQRTVTVRLEKEGWKVLDVSGEGKIEGFNRMPIKGSRRAR
jgi:hypothetical protein